MSLQDFEHILTEISPYTDYVYLHVKGEPLLHPKLQDILALCDKYQLHANITTNGTLIPRQRELLANAKSLRQVNISLHSFEEDTKNILSKEAIQDELNEYLSPIIEYSKYMSTHTHVITALRLWNLDQTKDSSVSKQQNALVISLLEDAYKIKIQSDQIVRGIKLMDRVYLNQDARFDWPSMQIPVLSDCGFCYGLSTQAAILVDGTVIPCCLDNEGDIALGNIFTSSITSIMNSPRAQEIIQGFRNHVVVEELCKRCGYRHRFT